MAARLRHRGPDDVGLEVRDGSGLACARLAIIDVPGGHQPLCNEDGTIWVVQNGEIYNYRSLREELLGRGHTLRTASDTEILVHLYEESGTDFVERLDGMFALALLDARRDALVLARDRFGVKPLFVAERGESVAVASEMMSLLCALPDAAELHDDALAAYLALGYVPGRQSLLRGIERLAPGEVRVYRAGGHQRRRYWQPPEAVGSPHADGLTPAHRRRTSAEREERTRELLTRSVTAMLMSERPLGVFLSGGQ